MPDNGDDGSLDFELEGPVSKGDVAPVPSADKNPLADFNDQDAIQMMLL